MIRILLVDDQNIIRQGLKALLELDPELRVVGTANNGQTAIEQVEALQPDIAIVDIRMPGMDGVAATQIISRQFPNTKVIVFSGYDDQEYLASALQAGARGYLLKDTPAEELASAIKSIDKGYAQIGPGLFEKITFKALQSNLAAPDQAAPSLPKPTPDQAAPSLPELTPDQAAPSLPELTPDQVAPDLPELSPLKQEVLRQLQSFDPKALLELVRLAIERGAVVELFAHINNQLKGDPTNLAALYLAGALWVHRGQGHKTLALHYLKFGFKEGIRQELSRDGLLLFYKEAALIDPEEAFSWLTQADGPWNSEEGLFFLLREAAIRFGTDSKHCRTLFALRQVRAIRFLSDRCASLALSGESMYQGFERFSNLLKV